MNQIKKLLKCCFGPNMSRILVNLDCNSSLCLNAEVKASVLEGEEVPDTKTVQREEREELIITDPCWFEAKS